MTTTKQTTNAARAARARARPARENGVFRTVRGLGSVSYGKKAQRLINQRIAKYGSIRAYYEYVNGGRKASTTEQK